MPVSIKIAVYSNSDDAFVAWSPSDFIPGCRGFLLERTRIKNGTQKVEPVTNRVGFKIDNPKSGDERPSSEWPFQRFNWTDHAVDVGHKVRYKVTAMIDDGTGRPYKKGPKSNWSKWTTLTPDVGDGISCYFNRGLVLSQFVARYLDSKKISPAKFKSQLKKSVDPKFRAFLEGDLGLVVRKMLKDAKTNKDKIHAALYELGDEVLEKGLINLGSHLNLILANGSDPDDGNAVARGHLNDAGIVTINRLLKSKGLGHNKFVVLSKNNIPYAAWTGSTNWSTTGLCTQVNNGILIESKSIANLFRKQWNLLKEASPPDLDPANFTTELVKSNDKSHSFNVGPGSVTIFFTRTSDGRDMKMLNDLIASAKKSILFLMFTPGKTGLHIPASQRANEKTMYVRGVVSTLGNTAADQEKNVLEIDLVSSDQTFKPDRYTVLQPQSVEIDLGPWIAEVTRKNFLTQVGHAIVHSKVMVIDALSDNPIVITGSHNFSEKASLKNDENLVIIKGHKKLAQSYATYIMSVYQHYRYRSYVRDMLAQGKKPWSYLEDNDQWLKKQLKSKAMEIDFWT